MPGNTTPAIFEAIEFADYDTIDQKDAVALLVDLGIINGVDQGDGKLAYLPDENMSRAAFAKIAALSVVLVSG